MSTLFDTTRNLSLYTIPAAWVLSLLPHVYATQLYEKASSRSFDLTQPRSLTASIASDQTIDKSTKDTIIRAEGAQQNGVENLGIFAAAVVAGNVAGLNNGYLNALSGGYVASRVVYNLVYINNTTGALAQTRSAVYLSGVAMCFTLFISAGNKLNSSVL